MHVKSENECLKEFIASLYPSSVIKPASTAAVNVYSDAIGTKITYVVTETLPEGSVYTKTGDGSNITATEDEVSGTVTITNTYEPVYTSVVVNKLWDDESDEQGLRNTVNATIQLYADGEALGDPVAVEVGTDDEWTYTFENLDGKSVV